MALETCAIKWIDSRGNRTPDTNPMVGLAIPWHKKCNCYGMGKAVCVRGVPQCEHTLVQSDHEPIPICATHEARMRGSLNWELIPVGGGWRL